MVSVIGNYIVASFGLIASISILYPLYHFGKAYIKGQLQSTKLLFTSAIILFITIFASFIIIIIEHLLRSSSRNLALLCVLILRWLYILQTIILLGVSFLRIHIVFQGSTYAISKCTIRLFVVFYFVVWLAAIVLFPIYMIVPSSQIYTARIARSVWTSILFIMIWLVSLYIYKLIHFHKSTHHGLPKDTKMVEIITKTSLLFIISLLTTVISTALFFFIITLYNADKNNKERHYFMALYLTQSCLFILDQLTIFVCIILSFSHYSNEYIKICGRFDSCCYRLWTKYVTNKIMMEKEIGSVNNVNDTHKVIEM